MRRIGWAILPLQNFLSQFVHIPRFFSFRTLYLMFEIKSEERQNRGKKEGQTRPLRQIMVERNQALTQVQHFRLHFFRLFQHFQLQFVQFFQHSNNNLLPFSMAVSHFFLTNITISFPILSSF